MEMDNNQVREIAEILKVVTIMCIGLIHTYEDDSTEEEVLKWAREEGDKCGIIADLSIREIISLARNTITELEKRNGT